MQPQLPQALTLLAGAVSALDEMTKTAMDAETQVAALKTQLAGKDQEINRLKQASPAKGDVVLQKVASLPDNLINETVDALIDRQLLSPAHRETIADGLRKDASFALKLIQKVASTQAEPAPAMGSGFVPAKLDGEQVKTAGVQDLDGWGDFIAEALQRK